MSYRVNDKELIAVLGLPPAERYGYLLGKVADWQELWSIADENGWTLMCDDAGMESVPIWPAEAFARACCVDGWSKREPRSIPIDDWLEKWLPGMMKDNRRVAAFPLPDGKGMVVSAVRFEEDVREALACYGE